MNAAARMLMGWWTEKALHSRGTPRPLFLVGTAALAAVVCLFLALAADPSTLYPLAVAMGLCFGSLWTLMPSLASELFGLEHFARWGAEGGGAAGGAAGLDALQGAGGRRRG